MIPLLKVRMPDEVVMAAAEVLRSGQIGQGDRVDEFEQLLGGWFGTPFVLTTSSCTAALQLALRLAEVKSGDSVISTPMTCVATNCAIRSAGADILWCDVDPVTGLIDPADLERKVSPTTKALMVVHWGGNPVDLDRISEISARAGLRVIEDAAHALGSIYRGRPIGTHSDFVCFSLQAVKHVSTGDGGILVCRSRDDYERGRLLRWYGLDRRLPAGELRLGK